MQRLPVRLYAVFSAAMLLLVLASPLSASSPAPVAAVPEDRARGDELVRSIVAPAIRDWLDTHREAWAPTDVEIDRMVAWMAAAKRCPGREPPPAVDPKAARDIATMFVAGPKKQRFLQRRFGGQRVLWQQFGTEAFDATHRLILSLEKDGTIAFATPADRTLALDYWTRDHGAWLGAYESDAASFPLLFEHPPCRAG